MAAKVEVDIFANDKTGGVLGGISKGLGSIMSTAAGFITGQVLMNAGAAIGDMFKSTIEEASTAQASLAQLDAAIKSTGGAAGLSSQELQDYATSLQDITAYDDEAIQGAESLLLTFTNVKGDVFKDATSTILDMSQAMGQDLKSSSIQLGKALNDPIAGIGALSRVGVQFTDDQKKMIEEMVASGDTMGAQRVILAELDKEFGGSAEAFANTYAGKMQQFNNTMGNVKETIGAALIPVMQDLMTNVVVPMIPTIQWLAKSFSEWMAGLRDSKLLNDMTKALQGLTPTIEQISEAFNTVSSFSLEGTPLGNFFAFLQSWATINGPGLMESFTSIFNTIWDQLSYVFNALSEVFATAMGTITIWLAKNGPLIQKYFALIAERVAFLGQIFKVIVDVAKPILDALIKMILDLVTFIMALATGDWAAAWEAFKSFFANAAEGIILGVIALWEGILGLFGTSSTELATKWNTFWAGIVASVSGWVKGIISKVGEFYDAGKQLIQGFINGIKQMIPNVVKAIAGVPTATNSEMQERYVMKSPSKLYEQYGNYIMEGFANGLKDGASIPIKAMGQIIPQINNAATFGTPAMAGAGGGGIVINIDARDSLIDERWFATKFKTGIVQVMRDTGVAFRG